MCSTGEEECIRTQNQYQKQSVSQEEEQAAACLHVMQLANSFALPAVLNTVVEFGIFDIISRVGGEGGKYFVKGEDDEAWVATGMFAHYIPTMEK
ncbi:hypothetical protein Ancab_034599, partial [Ancistrocladus abbreviatus]